MILLFSPTTHLVAKARFRLIYFHSYFPSRVHRGFVFCLSLSDYKNVRMLICPNKNPRHGDHNILLKRDIFVPQHKLLSISDLLSCLSCTEIPVIRLSSKYNSYLINISIPLCNSFIAFLGIFRSETK